MTVLDVNKVKLMASNKYISARRSELDTKSVLKISNLIDNKINDPFIIFSIPHITNDFVSQQLKHMSKTKAIGVDDISVNVLQLAAPAITPFHTAFTYNM